MEDQRGAQVASNPLVSTKILSHLDVRSLSRAQLTSYQWRDLCREIIRSRKQIAILCYAYDFTVVRNRRETMNVQVTPVTQLLHEKQLLGTNMHMMVEFLTDYLKNKMWCKPRFGILFHGGVKSMPPAIMSVVNECLPPDCQVIIVSSSCGFIPGVINASTEPPRFVSTEIQTRGNLIAGMSYLLCPDLGFEITPFDEESSLCEFEPRADNSHKKLKALIIFSNEYMRREGRREVYVSYDHVNNMFEKYSRQIALGGVVVDGIQLPPLNATWTNRKTASFSKRFCGLAISGDNIRAASGVFGAQDLDTLEREMREFRSSLDFNPDIRRRTQYTFGFLFICNGRGPAMFEHNEEVGLVNRVFPYVTFNGIFGDGEFGENYWPEAAAAGVNKCVKDGTTNFWHFYTNVVVLIHVSA